MASPHSKGPGCSDRVTPALDERASVALGPAGATASGRFRSTYTFLYMEQARRTRSTRQMDLELARIRLAAVIRARTQAKRG